MHTPCVACTFQLPISSVLHKVVSSPRTLWGPFPSYLFLLILVFLLCHICLHVLLPCFCIFHSTILLSMFVCMGSFFCCILLLCGKNLIFGGWSMFCIRILRPHNGVVLVLYTIPFLLLFLLLPALAVVRSIPIVSFPLAPFLFLYVVATFCAPFAYSFLISPSVSSVRYGPIAFSSALLLGTALLVACRFSSACGFVFWSGTAFPSTPGFMAIS